MKALTQIDFLAKPRKPWAGIAFAAAALTWLAVQGAASWQLEQSNRASATLLARRTTQSALPAPRKLTEAERVGLAQADKVYRELRAPWSDLLAAFEEHGQADIGLLKLEPDARASVVRITGHARSAAALFTYLHALERDSRLVDVLLTMHQTERDTPGKPVRFTIQAGWRATPVLAAKELS
jgi:Tfp pilus assembly protein PilN